MGTRTRTRVLHNTPPGLFRTWNGTSFSTTQQASEASERQSCDDSTGPYPYTDHALVLKHWKAEPLYFNGTAYYTTTRYIEYKSYHMRGHYSLCPDVPSVSWSYYRTKALANMNPSLPSVDIPVFLFELKDFPGMLRQLGRVLSKGARASDVAGSYVAYSFGWAPLISDVGKLINFSDLVNKRLKYLQKTSAKGGAKVSRTLDTINTTLSNGSFTGPTLPIIGTPVIKGSYVVTQERKVWSVANVASFLSPVQLDNPQLTAAKAALGLNLSAASLWEAIPWSWLVDYLGNIGDFLNANRGFIRSSVTNLNLMCKDEIANQLAVTEHAVPTVSVSGSGNMYTISKQRSVATVPVPSLASRPWFSPHMGGILGSLATSKALRKLGN